MVLAEVGQEDDRKVAAFIAVGIVAPVAALFALAVGSSAFAQEKREQTLDLLRLTYLLPGQVLVGKVTALLRITLPFVAFLLPLLVVHFWFDGILPGYAGVTIIAVFAVSFFFGSVGLFYSLVGSTPMRAAFPAVATFLYIVAGPAFLPIAFTFESEGIGIGAALGWVVVYAPVLVLVGRANIERLLVVIAIVGVWCGAVIISPEVTGVEFVPAAIHPIALVIMSVAVGVDIGSEQAQLVVATVVGITLLVGAGAIFLTGATALIAHPPENRSSGPSSPAVAAALSFVLPGMGQLYLGRSTRAALIMVVSVLLACGFGLANIAAGIDAYTIARRQRDKLLAKQPRESADGAVEDAPGDER